jgi:hypothetical protein
MNNNVNENYAEESVITIAKTDANLKAMELRKHNGSFEVLWTKSSKEGDLDWQTFATECGLSIESTTQPQVPSSKNVVVGYDSTGTAFYQVSIPAVEEREMDAIVQLQAESRLPLPSDQMELAWRINRTDDKQINITIAAARKQQVKGFIQKVIGFKPGKILLDCEAIVQTWKEVFSGDEQNAVIINAGAHNTQVCLVENSKLCNAVALDTGIWDFKKDEAEEESEITERFIQDMRSVVDLFDSRQSEELPVIVLSDDSTIYNSLISSLRSAGLNARAGLPKSNLFKNQLQARDIYEYRIPLGLALMTLNTDFNELNLFERMYKSDGEGEKKHWLYSPKITGSIAAAMLFLTILVFFAIDIAKPGVIEKSFKESSSETDISVLIEHQKLLKTIAQQRPDLLALLNDITKSGQINSQGPRGPMGMSGIQLDSFHFKKGQRISITGQASGNEQLYSFQDNLLSIREIRDVDISISQNTTRSVTNARSSINSRNGGNPRSSSNSRSSGNSRNPGGFGAGSLKFNINFNYKNFTSK